MNLLLNIIIWLNESHALVRLYFIYFQTYFSIFFFRFFFIYLFIHADIFSCRQKLCKKSFLSAQAQDLIKNEIISIDEKSEI